MKTLMLASVAIVGLAGGAIAHDRHSHSHSHSHSGSVSARGNTIVVSCYRGPQKVVYWDRANPAFYDSLRAAGYSASTSQAIGDRICRDQSLVDNLEAMKAEVSRIIRITPKDG